MARIDLSTDLDPAIRRAWPNVQFAFTQDGAGNLTWQQWTGQQPPPTGDDVQAAIDAYHAEQQAAADQNVAIRQQVVSIAQSAVGVSITALTAAQVRALVACLLWKAGALNPDGTVRPLADWLR